MREKGGEMTPTKTQIAWSAGRESHRYLRRVDLPVPLYRRREQMELSLATSSQEWRELAVEFGAVRAFANAEICTRKAGG